MELAAGLHDIVAADTLYHKCDLLAKVNLGFDGRVNVRKECTALSLSTDLGVTWDQNAESNEDWNPGLQKLRKEAIPQNQIFTTVQKSNTQPTD